MRGESAGIHEGGSLSWIPAVLHSGYLPSIAGIREGDPPVDSGVLSFAAVSSIVAGTKFENEAPAKRYNYTLPLLS